MPNRISSEGTETGNGLGNPYSAKDAGANFSRSGRSGGGNHVGGPRSRKVFEKVAAKALLLSPPMQAQCGART